MEVNITEMRKKAAEQEAARTEEFKKHLEVEKEQADKEKEKLQALLDKAGAKAAADIMTAMQEQVDTAIENVKAEIKAEYDKKHNVAECDDQREPLKKILGNLLGAKK